jgi:ubiquitin carboxyl-terminal hydrolase L5
MEVVHQVALPNPCFPTCTSFSRLLSSSGEKIMNNTLDLVGGPFAVIESDPGMSVLVAAMRVHSVSTRPAGVFSSLIRSLGVKRVEVVEIYDIEQVEGDDGLPLDPYGLILCFTWHKDTHRPADFDDPAAERVWFANQLSDDACATHAILNVLFNCPELDLGDELSNFRGESQEFSPMVRRDLVYAKIFYIS